jgi:hypothetical protein
MDTSNKQPAVASAVTEMPTPNDLWNLLSKREQNALKSLVGWDELDLPFEAFDGLVQKAYANVDGDDFGITPKGLEILTAGFSTPAAQTAPVTITAKQFVDEGYAEKVKRGECVVNARDDEQVIELARWHPKARSKIRFVILRSTIDQFMVYEGNHEFTVEWLTPPPATAQAPEAVGAKSRFKVGDYIEICVGRYTGVNGTIVKMDSETIQVRPDNGDLNPSRYHSDEIRESYATLRAALQAANDGREAAENRERGLREVLKPFTEAHEDYTAHCKNADYDGDITAYLDEFYASGHFQHVAAMVCKALAATPNVGEG